LLFRRKRKQTTRTGEGGIIHQGSKTEIAGWKKGLIPINSGLKKINEKL
jgi:hypothetical protein